MSEAELEILVLSKDDPDIYLDYWFRKKGQTKGWQFDHNFRESGKWQKEMCMALQNFIVAITGIGAGKTLGVVMAAGYHATMTRSFKFMNVAAQGWQSKLMHRLFLEHAKDTPFEKLIISSPTRPYPTITISFKVGEYVHESTLEFLSVGEKGDATNIMSWRGDWVNLEEAGLIESLNEVVGNLATRLTGTTAEGREYLARMSLISNPWENIELWQLYDMAMADHDDGLVFNIDTADNRNVTDKQIKLALKRIPEELHDKFMTGKRPQGRGDFFNNEDVLLCESEELQIKITNGMKEKKPGFVMKHNPILGVWHYQMPRMNGRIYYVVGDPGTGSAPARNAPTLGVWDVTDAPKFMPLVAFWWGNGNSSIMPFYNMLFKFIENYQPLDAFVDNTGTQKNTAELVNFDYKDELEEMGLRGIKGLDFASTRKMAYLRATQISVEAHSMQWPAFLKKSLSSQMRNYDYAKDKGTTTKLAQDCVAMVAMAAFAIRAWRRKNNQDEGEEEVPGSTKAGRDRRSFSRSRTFGRDSRREPSRPSFNREREKES